MSVLAKKITPQSNLIFTKAAACKVKSLIDEENNPRLNLRIFITGGGCSGFQYGFTFDEVINHDDLVIEKKLWGKSKNEINDKSKNESAKIALVRLLVDPLSLQYLHGAEIDYREDINGARFIVRNPNAKITCGCGSSFSA